ncbi:MAG: hypothetical protein Q8N81_03280 [bacterium]|nr:hypothetical protein [bacterium]
MIKIYEAKFQIERGEEDRLVEALNLGFNEEYNDLDIYLTTKRHDSFKIKTAPDGTILYQIKLVDGIFEVVGKTLCEEERADIIKLHPVEVEMHRTNRVFTWKTFMVKVDFDYIREFPDRAFLKIYSIVREPVEEAKKYLIQKGVGKPVDLAYNRLHSLEQK